MKTEQVTSEKESAVNAVIHAFACAIDDFDEAIYTLVCSMAAMTPEDRAQVVIKMTKLDVIPAGMLDRIAACAERGLTGARHLYGVKAIVRPGSIRYATPTALAQIADGETEVPVAAGKRKVKLVKVKDLDYGTAVNVWSPKLGALTPEQQLKAMEIKKPKPKATRNETHDVFKLTSVTPFDGKGGEKLVRVEGMNDSTGDPIECVFYMRQLKALLG